MVKLNRSAGEILSHCDGTRDVGAIVSDLEEAFVEGIVVGHTRPCRNFR